MNLVLSLTSTDPQLLRSFSLLGGVPAVCRFTQQTWPSGLRTLAASFVKQLCVDGDDTLRMFIACHGLKYLVGLVGEIPQSKEASALHPSSAAAAAVWTQALQEGSSLTHVGLACIWRVVDRYALLTLSGKCRLLAQNGVVPRLFQVLKQAIAAAKFSTTAAHSRQHSVGSTLPHQQPRGPTTAQDFKTAAVLSIPLHSPPPTARHARSASAAMTMTAMEAAASQQRLLQQSTSGSSGRQSVDGGGGNAPAAQVRLRCTGRAALPAY